MTIRFFRASSSIGIAAALVATFGYAAAQSQPQNLKLVSADASLTQRLDSSSATQGQAITASLADNVKTANAMELPKGTLLMGKVESVQPSTNKGPAKMSIIFNEARLKDGHIIPVKATLLAAYSANDAWEPGLIDGSMHFIPDNQTIVQDPGALSHIAMQSAVQSDASAVFTSKDRNINLNTGTRFQIAIAPETSISQG